MMTRRMFLVASAWFSVAAAPFKARPTAPVITGVVPGNGSGTVMFTANPGRERVLEYEAVAASG